MEHKYVYSCNCWVECLFINWVTFSFRQTEEMEEKVRMLNISSTEEEINELAAQQFEQQALVAGRWGSQLDALRQTQRAQHRAWLMDTLQEYQSTSALNTPRFTQTTIYLSFTQSTNMYLLSSQSNTPSLTFNLM